MVEPFEFPEFFDYPPYFTVQPNPDTQRKQTELWKSLILGWCQHHRSFTLRLDDDAHPLWRNDAIDRRLPPDARRRFVDALAADGAAAWLDGDPGPKSRCLVFWRSLDDWCDELQRWAATSGLEGQIVTAHEVTGGGETEGPPAFEGAPAEFVASVGARLEQRDKGAYVPEQGEDDAGIKFF